MRRRTTTGLLLVVLWSSGFVGTEFATPLAPAVTVLAWRFMITAAVLAVICLVAGVRFERSQVGRQVVVGGLSQIVYLLPVFVSVERGVDGGIVSMIAALQPLLVAVVAGSVLGEPSDQRQRAGLVLGFLGVVIVISGDLTVGAAPWWANLLPLLAVVGLSGGTVLGRRWQSMSFLAALTVQSATACAVMVGVATVTGQLAAPASAQFAVAVGWLGILSGLGGYGVYVFVVRQQGATAASTWLYLTPPVTMLWIWLMFDERIGALGFLGLAVTGAGVALALRSRRAATPASSPVPR